MAAPWGAFEATGNDHRPIAWRLLDKNDLKEAQVILHMARIQATQRYDAALS